MRVGKQQSLKVHCSISLVPFEGHAPPVGHVGYIFHKLNVKWEPPTLSLVLTQPENYNPGIVRKVI